MAFVAGKATGGALERGSQGLRLPIRGRGSCWFRSHGLAGGDVVLLHDSLPHDAAAILPDLIAATHCRGLRFGTLAEWDR